jgi:hypothetical protein
MAVIERLVHQLAEFPGVQGCALVDAETGMAWHHAGRMPDMDQVGEAAIEFWRVHKRLAAHFRDFGQLHSSAHSFATCVIALFPCSQEPALVLVCVADKGRAIDWAAWGKKMPALKQALAAA